ncbi:hypothetical protein [Actinokineospora spheciospongiae]|uniref:hypothetical protein n=1 Tax=Actinokineospora spheciospongiae TaxID=909613 RepID=UPI000D717A04|nr:hypothetical protein [Actinokineospora spheciospongiae]PWW51945.1 hypothetical protein DFQ13_11940 [Actinokineospora spheciospongiae]
MHAVLLDPLVDPVPDAWDGLVAATGAPALWRSALLVTAAWAAQAPTVLGVVSDGSEPVALFHGRFQGPTDVRRFARPGAVPVAGVFECRLAPASVAGYRFARSLDAAGRRAAVVAFESAVRARFRWRVAGFCYRHVTEDVVPAVSGRFRGAIAVSPDTVLDVEWTAVADYLRVLPPKWRSQLRKIRATVAEDTAVRREVAAAVPAGQAARLVNQVRDRHRSPGVVRPPIPERYFTLLNDDPSTRFTAYRAGSDLLAVSTVHDTGAELVMSYWGIRDRTEGGRPNLYFDHYVAMVELAITSGRRALLPGKGMTHIKERFGARTVPNFVVVGR